MPQVKKINLKVWTVLIAMLLACPYFLYADETVIQSDQAKLILDSKDGWNIHDGDSLKIVYAGSASDPSALLRDNSGNRSYWGGSFWSNYSVLLVNPNGITFGANANIQAANFIASTLNITNADFLAGRNNFFKDGANAFILNQGNIIIRNGGYVCLLSQAVENQGTIIANLGTVVMAAGEKMTLALDDLNNISVVIDEDVSEAIFGHDSAIKNSGSILANGGKVILTAKILNRVFDYAINNTGIIEAKAIVEHDGIIELVAEGAPIINTGTLTAGEIKVNTPNTEFINKGKVIAEAKENIVNSGIITIQVNSLLQGGSIIADKLISVTADKIDVFIKDNPLAVEVDPLLNTSLAVIMQAPEVKVIARQFGSNDAPVNISAPLTYIYRTSGDINILDSLGIGTSILLRGPPDGFGAILYNRDTNLTLEASQINLVGSAPTYLYGNITFSNFTCTVPVKEIYFEAGKTYTVLGSFKIQGAYAQPVKLLSSEVGTKWYFDPKGAIDISYAWVEDSYNLGPIMVPMTESTNRGTNFNWDATATWTGASSANWSNGGNWSGIGGNTPGAGDNLVFPAGALTPSNTNDIAGASFNSITISGSGYTLSGSSITITGYVTDSNASGSNTINLDLSFGATRTITVTNSGETLTINGVISGAGGLTKEGSGTLTLTGANTYSDATSINGGALTLTGSGTAVNSTFTVNYGGILTLDNSGTNNDNRIAGILTMNGGEFVVVGNATNNTAEVIGALTLSSGYSTVTLTPNAAKNVQVTFASLTISSGVLGLFRGTNLGANTIASQTANTSNLVFTTAPALSRTYAVGGTTCGIISGAIGAITSASLGTDFVTYDPAPTNGVRILAAAEYTSTPAANVNLKVTANTTSNTSLILNSILLSGGVSYGYDNAGGSLMTLGITSGSILSIGGSNSLIAADNPGGTVTLSSEGKIFALTDLTYGASCGRLAGASGLTKGGTGNFIVSRTTTISGGNGITINQGTLRSGVASAFASQAVTVGPSGTFDLNGFNNTITTLTLLSGSTFGASVTTGSGTLRLGGNVTLNVNGSGATDATISGKLALGSSTRTFTIADGTATSDLTISAVISNPTTARGITKTGSGTLTLSGANTYTGVTTISAGTLSINTLQNVSGGSSSLGAPTTVANGTIAIGATGTLQYTGSGHSSDRVINKSADGSTIDASGSGTLTLTGGVTGSNNNLVLTGTGNGIETGVIGSGNATLTKQGAGTWTLSGANTYTGATTISAGTLKLGVSSSSSSSGPLGTTGAGTTVASGASLDLNGFSLTSAATEALSLSGTGVGSLGALTNSSTTASTYIGVITFTNAASIVGQGGTIAITGTPASGTTAITLGGSAGGSISTVIAGGRTLTKEGTGTWILSGASTYTGLTTISAGTLKLGVGSNVTTSGPLGTNAGGVTVSSGAVLDLNGFTIGAINAEALTINGTGLTVSPAGALTNTGGAASYLGTITLGSASTITATTSGTLTVAAVTNGTRALTLDGAGTGTVSGVIGASTGTVTKNGAGTWTLSGTNTYTGLTTISAGTLKLNNTAALGTIAGGTTVSATGAALDLNGITLSTAEPLTLNGTGVSSGGALMNSGAAVSYSGAITLGSASSIGTTGNITLGGGITGGQDLTKVGDGILSLGSSTATLGGLTISAGTLTSTSGTMNLAGDFSNSGTFTNNSGTVTFNGTGAQTISGANTFYGLQITGGDRTVSFQSGVAQSIAANGSLTLTGTSGHILTLAPLTAASEWQLNVNTTNVTQSVSYVSVSYSNASGGSKILAPNSVGAVSDINWAFDATKLVITTEPSGATAGSTFTTQPVVKTYDAYNNLSTVGLGANVPVVAAIDTGTGSLQGTASLDIGTAAGNGTVTYTNLRMDTAQAGAKLKFTNAGFITATSAAFTVNPDVAAKLEWDTQPSSPVTAGATWNTFKVKILDQFGNIADSTADVTVTPSLGTFASGTTTKNASGGIATFDDLTYTVARDITVTGTTTGLASTPASSNITVTPGAGTLAFIQQPTNANAGATISPSPKVEIRDAYDNLCTSVADITLSIDVNPGSGTLSGTLTKSTSSGVATFDGLSINKAGVGYTLKAASGTLTAVNSDPFNIISTPTDHVIDNQISNAIVIRPVLPDLGQLGGIPINIFNAGPVFLYHPLTPGLTGAFGAIAGGGMPGGAGGGVPFAGGAGAPGGLVLMPGGIIAPAGGETTDNGNAGAQ